MLARIVERGSVGESDEDLRRTSAAVAWAVDLYHISTCLGEQSFRSIAVELSKITHGSLLVREQNSVAKNYLSQFWIGALLAQGKLSPAMLAHEVPGKSKPDYLFQLNSVKFAAEVKRPSNWDSASRLVEDAGDQIRRFDRPGIIIVDATDCVSPDPYQVVSSAETTRSMVSEELGCHHEALVRHIETYSRSDKFHQVTMLMTYVRYWPWERGETLHRAAGITFRGNAVFYRWSHQVTELTRQVQKAIVRGVEQLTGNPTTCRFY